MITQSAGELLRELRINGHWPWIRDGGLVITPNATSKLTDAQVEAIKANKEELIYLLGTVGIREAMYKAIDTITNEWPRSGDAPAPSLEVIAREAAMDAACHAEPMDTNKARTAIEAWVSAWLGVVRARKGGGR